MSDVPGQIYRAATNGCKACRGTGYRGRTSISELMMMDDEVRSLVMKNADAAAIRRACTSRDMRLLRQDGADRIIAGLTTIEELLTVTQEEIE
jgi:general secretion pathway protein E